MTKTIALIASTATALLFAGNALAQMPASGEGPFFEQEARLSASRDNQPRATVSIRQVAAGEQSGRADVRDDPSQPTRAEVRQQTRDAIADGQGPAIGNRSDRR